MKSHGLPKRREFRLLSIQDETISIRIAASGSRDVDSSRDGSAQGKRDTLNHELSLTLEFLEQAPEYLRFLLVFRNCSKAKVLVPLPEIHGLRFGNKATMKECAWYTRLLVSRTWGGFTLGPEEKKVIEYQVRPCDIETSTEDDNSDYYRWCVELPPGEYLVWFQFEVAEDYFCADSHYRYIDLLREAESAQAVVWTGILISNRLTWRRSSPID